MITAQRLPASLTPLDAALAAVLRDLAPVQPIELPPADALRCIAAEMPALRAYPLHDVAVSDGWAMRANDLVGASSYAPLPLAGPPVWVAAGAAMPDGTDCVVDADAVDTSGPLPQVLAEAIPGQGVRRAGSDIAAGRAVIAAGEPLLPRGLLLARVAGLELLRVRRPRLRIVNICNGQLTAQLVADTARLAGVEIDYAEAAPDVGAIANALEADGCDLIITIGGTGVGHTDAAVNALAARGALVAHGIALQPGRTTAVGRIGATPVVALPGAPDQAFAVWWTIALPVLDRLSGRRPRKSLALPLERKIASGVGIAEVVLLTRRQGSQHGSQQGFWAALAIGDLSLDAIARAEGLLIVPGAAEGFAAGTVVDAYMLRE
ncbi:MULTISPECIES: molybdopterin-binding protein [unclassified Bradyrhizobium]|uniref:molybdopterin-binding protein n=1 Tax=unclassified Bradyrhizobium TaxID=2631580 RepID=UPI001BA7C4FF|nr:MULTISPECIES: molybdopterin-binding protein [unclassified Bradyrhizobium]MBR1208947.1 molybdopterin-binding protein [Bradyrhizobium sp. AUGA SZCCT0124]MBR1317201.1 molybdopterin-binding protein [Bradyrhizobium sp. AUGA SZCCT0051]MBR1345620.1 molybdopterin-binding protein [Bradyrhizobium sp. AUGA SZCCT0105]MBR1360359.1 molybdopterin-binding protein [Bradyrhizobium sp. AUGA SZCCT0045]